MSIRTAKISLENCGLVLIKGINNDNPNFLSNGAGKSTIIESIVYVLFGRTLRGVKGDKVVSNVVKKNCKVILDLKDEDGTSYRIARYRKHQQNKNNVFLFCNGVDITPKSDADFTKKVMEILQTDFMTFTSSIIYSAESFKFTQATDSELKSAFDVMLDLKVYSDCLEETKNQMKELNLKTADLDRRVDNLTQKKFMLNETLTTTKQASESFKSHQSDKIEELTEKIQSMEDDKADYEEELEDSKEELELLKRKIDSLKAKKKSSTKTSDALKELRQSISDSEDELDEINSKKRKVKSYINTLEHDKENCLQLIERSEKHVKSLEDDIRDMKESVGTPCPTCGKPLDKEHIKDGLEEAESLIKKEKDSIDLNSITITECDRLIRNHNKELEKIKTEEEEINDEIEEYRGLVKKLKERQEKEHDAERKILVKERELNRLEAEYTRKKTAYESIESRIEDLEEQIVNIDEEKNPYEEKITEYENMILELEPKFEELDKMAKELNTEKEVLEFWLKGFSNSGIKSMLLDDITPFLNERTNKYLGILSDGRLSVNFTTQTKLKNGEVRDKFQIELHNTDGGEEYMSNSSGEKRRVDVAINLALCDLIASRANKRINITFMDEILDSALDAAGMESIMSLLKEMSKEKSSIFVISHNEQIQTYFDNTLVVTKTGGCSTVEFE